MWTFHKLTAARLWDRIAIRVLGTRDEKRTTSGHSRVVRSISSLENLEMYVQNLCDATPDQASVIVEAAGMRVASKPVRHKPELSALNGPTPGSAVLIANRGV